MILNGKSHIFTAYKYRIISTSNLDIPNSIYSYLLKPYLMLNSFFLVFLFFVTLRILNLVSFFSVFYLESLQNHKAQRRFRKQRIGKARKRQRAFCQVRRCGVKSRFGNKQKTIV